MVRLLLWCGYCYGVVTVQLRYDHGTVVIQSRYPFGMLLFTQDSVAHGSVVCGTLTLGTSSL